MTLTERLMVAFLEEQPADAAHALELLGPDARVEALRISPAAACQALRAMSAAAAVETLLRLPPQDAATTLGALPIDAAVALLRRMPPASVDRVLEHAATDRRDTVRGALRYPEGTAGALMDPEVLAVADTAPVAEARVRLRRAPQGLLYYVYIVDRSYRLVGVLDIPELMRASGHATMAAVMRTPVERLPAWMPAAAVRIHPAWRVFHALPVVDDEDHLVGAIRYQTFRRLERDAAQTGDTAPAHLTVTALGELFHLGVASLLEGVAAVSAPRERHPSLPRHPGDRAGDGGAR